MHKPNFAKFLAQCALSAALAALTLAPAQARQTADTKTDDPQVERLLKRIEDLEARLKGLEDKESKEKSQPVAAPATAPATESKPPAAAPTPPPQPAADQAAADAVLQEAVNESSLQFGRLQFRGFSDITIGRPLEENLPDTGLAGSHYSFTVGDLSLFITSQLSPKLSFYSELLFTSDFSNLWSAEIDRLMLQYKANDYFQVGVGRFNTALGYYTNNINRAKFFQTATSRPFMYSDEDVGGILPVHSIGVTMSGKVPSGGLGLHWVGELSNGLASMSIESEPNQNLYDENNRKAYNVGFYVQPDTLRGFQAGVSNYRDKLEPAGMARVAENITAAYVVLVRPQFEFMNEAVVRTDSPAGSSESYRTLMGYTQIGRRFGNRIRPYLRFEYMGVPRLDPVIGGIGVRKEFMGGVRYEAGEFLVFKAQLGRTWWNGVSAMDPQIQLAFTF